jgi:hypothetical protein
VWGGLVARLTLWCAIKNYLLATKLSHVINIYSNAFIYIVKSKVSFVVMPDPEVIIDEEVINDYERRILKDNRWLVRQADKPDANGVYHSQLVLRTFPSTDTLRGLKEGAEYTIQGHVTSFDTRTRLIKNTPELREKVGLIYKNIGYDPDLPTEESDPRKIFIQSKINHLILNFSSDYTLTYASRLLENPQNAPKDITLRLEKAKRQVETTSLIIDFLVENIPTIASGEDYMVNIAKKTIRLGKVFDFMQILGRARLDESTFKVNIVDQEALETAELPLLTVIDLIDTISNAVKHGGATAMEIGVETMNDNLEITISDNGSGLKSGVIAEDITKMGATTTMSTDEGLSIDKSGGSGNGMGYMTHEIDRNGGTTAIWSKTGNERKEAIKPVNVFPREDVGVQIVVVIPLRNLYPQETGLKHQNQSEIATELKRRGYIILQVPEELKSKQPEILAESLVTNEP